MDQDGEDLYERLHREVQRSKVDGKDMSFVSSTNKGWTVFPNKSQYDDLAHVRKG